MKMKFFLHYGKYRSEEDKQHLKSCLYKELLDKMNETHALPCDDSDIKDVLREHPIKFNPIIEDMVSYERGVL